VALVEAGDGPGDQGLDGGGEAGQPQPTPPQAGELAELLCESVDLRAGERVLDVPCGSGNAALAAARRFCRAVGVDAPEPLERARRRAEAEELEVAFLEGDAEDLPFLDGSFDVVLSAGLEAMAPKGAQERLRELAGRFDVSEDDTLVLRLDYLVAVVRKPVWR
jgi:SAM-dependent methyltransferase